MAEKDFKEIEYRRTGASWAIYPAICKSCGLCIERCPQKCLNFDNKNNDYLGNPLIRCEIDRCISCHVCENMCPDGAIKINGGKK